MSRRDKENYLQTAADLTRTDAVGYGAGFNKGRSRSDALAKKLASESEQVEVLEKQLADLQKALDGAPSTQEQQRMQATLARKDAEIKGRDAAVARRDATPTRKDATISSLPARILTLQNQPPLVGIDSNSFILSKREFWNFLRHCPIPYPGLHS